MEATNRMRQARPHELAHGPSETARVTGIRVSGFEWEGRECGYAGQNTNARGKNMVKGMGVGRYMVAIGGRGMERLKTQAEARLNLIALRVG